MQNDDATRDFSASRGGDAVEDRTGASGGEPATAMRADRLERVPWGAVILFALLACGLAWLVALPIWLSGGPAAPNLPTLITFTGVVMMFTPALATLVVVFALRVPRGERLRFLGMWPLRPAKRVVWFLVGGLLLPPLIVAAVALVSAALGLVRLDLLGFSGFGELIEGQLAALGPEAAAQAAAALPPVWVLFVAQLASIPFGALVNSVFAFGEELGWRGWLLPALRPLGAWPALILSGVLWGFWHSPLILLGYNFGLTDWRGVALMIGGCVAWGVLLGWARLRSGSVWPAVVGHGALNAGAGLVVLLAAAGENPDLAVVGPLGMISWGVIAAIVVVLVLTGQFGREPELAPRRPVPTTWVPDRSTGRPAPDVAAGPGDAPEARPAPSGRTGRR